MRDDDRAEITGLPLYLMILVVVAGVGLALVMGFTDILAAPPSQFGPIEFDRENPYPLNSCPNDRSQACEEPNFQFLVIVRDSDANRLDGAVVEATGGGFSDGSTTSGGEAYLEGEVTIPANKESAEISILVSKADFPDARTTFVIVRSIS